MKVYFIRHGLAESNMIGPDSTVGQYARLTPEGRQQMTNLAHFLGKFVTADTIYASPLPRTRESAAILADILDTEIVIDERIAEINKGVWQGMPVEEVIELEAKVDIDDRPYYRPPQGENWSDVGERVADCVEELRRVGISEAILVSHDHPIRMGIGKLTDQPISEWEAMPLNNASVTELDYDEGRWQLSTTLHNFRPATQETHHS
jgi:broad specificity phosphatase PhoE